MARMIPSTYANDNDSPGEEEIFKELEKLPDEYTIFHSVKWNKKKRNKGLIKGEADFTLFHKDKGILVIEVKSGIISYEYGTWKQENRKTHEINKIESPLDQADKSLYRFLEVVNEVTTDINENCFVCSAVWFPSICRDDLEGKLPLQYEKELVLYDNDVDNAEEAIEKLYKYHESSTKTNMSAKAYKKLISMFSQNFCVMPSMKSKMRIREKTYVEMTQEQAMLLDYLEEQRVATIQGAAGTGKTLLALEKARRISEDEKTLFLCFNQFLYKYLAATNNTENLDIYNLHTLAAKKLNSSNVKDSDISAYLCDYDSYQWDYKHIIIDEGQDFIEEHIEFLSIIAEQMGGHFYVFFDKNQFIQRSKFPDWLSKAECRLVLSKNCRNTYEIATTSGKPVGVIPNMKIAMLNGERPNFHCVCDRINILTKINEIILDYVEKGVDASDITILTTQTEDKSILADISKIGKYKITHSFDGDGIVFTTVRKFKGLESDVVIIVDMNSATFEYEENRRIFYVGTSRAKHFLELVFLGDDEELIKMSTAINPEYKGKNSRLNIASTLNIKMV